MEKFIIYTRVSTARQGESGLGLEAQLRGCTAYIESKNGRLLNEYREVESGWKAKHRPALQAALKEAREQNAALVVWKLDRLGRRMLQLLKIIEESRVKVVIASDPNINDFMLKQMMIMAEHESKIKSERVKDMYESKRKRNPSACFGCGTAEKVKAMNEGKKESALMNPRSRQAAAVVSEMVKQGQSLRAIADRLNRFGFLTPSGQMKWYASSVKNLVNKLNDIMQFTDN